MFSRLGLALVTGYVWFFTGERVFWSFLHTDQNIPVLTATWLVYSFFAYIALACIDYFRVRSVWALFLLAALYGWLIEGLVSLTVFGGAGMPFPLSISWTGLAWHAVFIVWCWYMVRVAITQSSFKTLLHTIALGLVWGSWSLWWALENPPQITTPDMFFLHAAITSALYLLALHSYTWIAQKRFIPTRLELGFFGVLVLAYYAIITIPASPVLALTLLPALLLLTLWGLRKNRMAESEASVLADLTHPLPWGRSLLLLLTPLVASLLYNTGLAISTNWVFFVVLTPLGTILFVVSLFMVWKRAKKRSSEA